MNWRHWINKYGAVAVLLMLLFVTNPELRALLWVANVMGLELIILLVGVQLRCLLPAAPLLTNSTSTALCVVGYATVRVTTRTIALLLPPGRATAGLTALLFVLSKNMWCPRLELGYKEI